MAKFLEGPEDFESDIFDFNSRDNSKNWEKLTFEIFSQFHGTKFKINMNVVAVIVKT